MFERFRLEAKKTREEAAFRLHIAVRTLYSYEKGHQLPPPEVVCGMAEVYSNPYIPRYYCENACPIGMAYGCPAQKETAPCGAA
ncbi:MAG TPA: helix-turn-helix transcriptional regulator [Clostridiaceae bacterium]|nr:helix-turn-helix transcriptional regulator [Clostridiaceae bacterium]